MILKSILCDYSDVCILVKGTITVPNTKTGAVLNNNNIKIIFKNCAPFADCKSEINDTQLHIAKDTDVLMPM